MALGDRMVPFSLPATDGTQVSAEEITEPRVVGIVFWCNHCPYVRAWEDRLIALQREFSARGVQFVLISSNDPLAYPNDSFANMGARASDKAYPFPYLFDESQQVARAYGAMRTPEVFLFGPDRTLRYHGAIDDNFEDPNGVTHAYLSDAIEALLADREPPVASTSPVGCTIKWKA